MEETIEDRHQREYWEGPRNKSIRYWFYVNRGMDWVNQFRNLVICLVAVYLALKLKNPAWLVGMLAVSLPVLGLIGFLQVHYIGKVLDWLNVRFSTHYQLYTVKLQEEIRDGINKLAKDKER